MKAMLKTNEFDFDEPSGSFRFSGIPLRFLFERRFWVARICSSVASISRRHGILAAIVACLCCLAISLASLAICYFCMEGCIRSVIEIRDGNDDRPGIIGLRPLGDFGGWFSICIFSLLSTKAVFDALLREGEYLQSIELVREWCVAHDRQKCRDCLEEACSLLALINARAGPFRRTAAQVHVDALRAVYQEDSLKEGGETSAVVGLADDLSRQLSMFRIPRRWITGVLVLVQSGVCGNIVWIFFGAILPVCLMVNAVLSIVGLVGLGVELFVLRQELTDVGHFGEWMFNSVESFSAAVILIFLFVVNEGDLLLTKKIYQEHCRRDSVLISSLALQDLSSLAPLCSFWKTPEDIKLDDL